MFKKLFKKQSKPLPPKLDDVQDADDDDEQISALRFDYDDDDDGDQFELSDVSSITKSDDYEDDANDLKIILQNQRAPVVAKPDVRSKKYEEQIKYLKQAIKVASEQEEKTMNTNTIDSDEKIEKLQGKNIESDTEIENILASLNMHFVEFKQKYNDKHLEDIYGQTPEVLMDKESSLNRQFEKYKNNMNEMLVSTKSFNKYIQDIAKILTKLSRPNPANYINWDVKQIIVWIKGLENGRYNKYIDTLTAGFVESEMTGNDLPDILSSDLHGEPFHIKNFRDKKDLVQHFHSLPILAVKDVIEDEGAPTVYI